MIHIRDDVGDPRDLPLDRARAVLRIGADRDAVLPLRMPRDAVAHFPRQVQPLTIILEHVDYTEALLVMVEAAGDEVVEHTLAGVAEWGVTEVMAKCDRLGELFIQPQHLGNAAGDLRHLERVRQPRAIVIPGRREEDLPRERTEALGRTSSERIGTMVTDVVLRTLEAGLSEVRMSEGVLDATVGLRSFLFETVYENEIATAEFKKAAGILGGLWGKIQENPKEFLDQRTVDAEGLDVATKDFVAGMTHRYAVSLFEQLFVPKPWIEIPNR